MVPLVVIGFRRVAVAVGALVLAGAGVVAVSGTAVAAPSAQQETLTLSYPVNGSTHINSTDSDLTVGPGTLVSTVDATGAVVADLTLPPSTGSFRQFGFIPVTVTTEFVPVGQTTGQLDLTTGAVQSTSRVTLKLDRLNVGGLVVPVGPFCRSQTPATITLNSGPGFSVAAGGPLSGTYTIPPFEHCLLAAGLINSVIPGVGNTIDLTLGTPTLVPPPA